MSINRIPLTLILFILSIISVEATSISASTEELCSQLEWQQPQSDYWKYHKNVIWCHGRIQTDGDTTNNDVSFEQFKKEVISIYRNLSEEELESSYQICAIEGYYKFDDIPLEGFLKECHGKVYPIVGTGVVKDEVECKKWRDVGEDHTSCYGFRGVDGTSYSLCYDVKATYEYNKELIENQSDFGNGIMNVLIDCGIKKEFERRKREEDACKNRIIGQEGYDEVICFNDSQKDADVQDNAIAVKPDTKKEVEVKTVDKESSNAQDKKKQKVTLNEETDIKDIKSVEIQKQSFNEESSVGQDSVEEKKEENQSTSIFTKILSFFKRLFS